MSFKNFNIRQILPVEFAEWFRGRKFTQEERERYIFRTDIASVCINAAIEIGKVIIRKRQSSNKYQLVHKDQKFLQYHP